jgi:ribose-phosphate pyrophosphokinase
MEESFFMLDEMKVFTGNTHPALAKSICEYLKIPVGRAEVFEFSNENIFVRILENIRGRDVFLLQPISSPVQKSLVELLIMIDAAKRASADRITAVIPYYGYGRTDKKDQPRVPITARLIADLLQTAGANRVLTVDLHAGQIQGFFNIPVDELTALYLIRDYFKRKNFENMVVVATDMGISKRARDLAAKLNCPLAIGEKRRLGNSDQTETQNIIGDVKGKIALILDDEIDTGGSITGVASTVQNLGAADIYACCTHPIFSGPAAKRLAASPIREVVVTDTVPLTREKKLDKVTVLSVAPMLGEAIRRIHTGMSIGSMFEEA